MRLRCDILVSTASDEKLYKKSIQGVTDGETIGDRLLVEVRLRGRCGLINESRKNAKPILIERKYYVGVKVEVERLIE